MKSAKEQTLKTIQRLPEDCTIEDIRYQIGLLATVLDGMKAAEEGRAVPQEEAERRMAQWQVSRGQSKK